MRFAHFSLYKLALLCYNSIVGCLKYVPKSKVPRNFAQRLSFPLTLKQKGPLSFGANRAII